nr:hypothetical protein [Tanacetum cinerariifolium]
MLTGGFCFPCNLKAENSYNCYQNAYSFNDSSYNPNYLPQPQYENYLCNLCGNNSHDGYDCQQQFPFIYEQEPSYNQNYNDNYYPHDSSSFPCCDNCEKSHETFQCQPINQNVDFLGSDQIQTPQYPDVHPLSQEINEEGFHAKEDLMKSIQTFLEEFNCIPFEEKPPILLEAWFKFFAIKRAQPKDSNELFQKLLEDLKELAKYKESLENSSKEIAVSNSKQEKEDPPQDSDIRQLIREECCVEVSEEQKQKMEDTMLELVKICQQKEFFCIHDNVEDLIESAFNSKLLLINSNSQRLDEKEQDVKNVVEQPVERGNLAPILSTKEHEHSLSMGYEHLSITPETESNEVTESNAENLLPIPSECESNPLFNNDDLDSSDDESLPDEDVPAEEFKVYSNLLFSEDEINSDKLDPHCFNVESNFVESLLNRDTFIESSSKFDFSGELAHVNPEIKESDFDFEEEIRLIENLLYDNSSPRPPKELNAEIADTIVESIPSLPIPVQDGDSQREEIDIVTETDDMLPPSVENDDDSSSDPLLEEADLFLFDNSIPSGIENFANDSEGDIRFLEELLIDDSILSHKSSDSNFEDNPSIPQPPPEPPDVESFFDLKPDVIAEEIPDKLNEDKCFDPGREINVSTKIEDDDYFPFMFVIRFFLPYLIFPEVSPLFLSAGNKDTIFDHGFTPSD